MWHGAPFPPEPRVKGPDPKRTSYGSFFAVNDPDGNAWIVQEVTARRPGRTRSSIEMIRAGREAYQPENRAEVRGPPDDPWTPVRRR
jgi:hypothetical protein